jgi:3-oxoacid CoA-transferase subunit A
MKILICGDLHGSAAPIRNFYEDLKDLNFEDTWIILLGDSGLNYYDDSRDSDFKDILSHMPFKYFVIRGNHDRRVAPLVERNKKKDAWHSTSVFGGKAYYQLHYPNIYYALDEGGIYDIGGYKTLVIPGAYSVDKWYRLHKGWNWFEDEQLTKQEQKALMSMARSQYFHLVLSHTCPYSWMPTDLFLDCIDQTSVDNSMEKWMDKLRKKTIYGLWCFGHFHADRAERPWAQMFYKEVQMLDSVLADWTHYEFTGDLPHSCPKSPQFDQKGPTFWQKIKTLFKKGR